MALPNTLTKKIKYFKVFNKMNQNFNEENIKKIIAWKSYIDQGCYGDARDIVNTYNMVFKNVKQPQQYTQCGSCLRRCVLQMYGEYQNYMAELKAQQEKLAALEAIDEFMTDEEVEEKPKRGRPKKK